MENEIKNLQDSIITVTNKKITIVAATKTQSIDKMCKLPSFGITIVGENRVQELLQKYNSDAPLTWHFIGALQTNKVKYIVDKVSMIQSVDSIRLADEIEKQCAKIYKVMPVLVEVNMGETNKRGVIPLDLNCLCEHITTLDHLRLVGLMAVMPTMATEEQYYQISQLYSQLKEKYNFLYLSVGMSNDYLTAIKYGSNMIRIGEKIFGKRIYNE